MAHRPMVARAEGALHRQLAPMPGRVMVSGYIGIMVGVERVQTGVRVERRLLKVLKALAEYLDLSLGDLVEGIVLHAFERKAPFDDATVEVIERLKEVYGLDLTAADSHHLDADDEDVIDHAVERKRPARERP